MSLSHVKQWIYNADMFSSSVNFSFKKQTKFKTCFGTFVSLIIVAICAYYGYLILSHPFEINDITLYNSTTNETNTNEDTDDDLSVTTNVTDNDDSTSEQTSNSTDTAEDSTDNSSEEPLGGTGDGMPTGDTGDGVDSNSPDSAMFWMTNYGLQNPYIYTNQTVLVPQLGGFNFGAKFSDNLSSETTMSIVFRIVTKDIYGIMTYENIPSQQCTPSNFNGFYFEPIESLNISDYLCPSNSDLIFYSNSKGHTYRHVEIIVNECENTSEIECESESGIREAFQNTKLELIFKENTVTEDFSYK